MRPGRRGAALFGVGIAVVGLAVGVAVRGRPTGARAVAIAAEPPGGPAPRPTTFVAPPAPHTGPPATAVRRPAEPAEPAEPADTSGAVRAAETFVTAYGTWHSPDGPAGTVERVATLISVDLFDHFPGAPAEIAAPSAVAVATGCRVVSVGVGRTSPSPTGSGGGSVGPAPGSRARVTLDVAYRQQLLAQDGKDLGPPRRATMAVTVEGDDQDPGVWLVQAFTPVR